MLKYAIYYSIIENNIYYQYDTTFKLTKVYNNDKYFNNTLKMLDALGTDD